MRHESESLGPGVAQARRPGRPALAPATVYRDGDNLASDSEQPGPTGYQTLAAWAGWAGPDSADPGRCNPRPGAAIAIRVKIMIASPGQVSESLCRQDGPA